MEPGDIVDQVLVDRIVELVKKSGTTLPNCWDWRGSGNISEAPLDDGNRRLTRSAHFDFHFTLDADMKATGTITLTYDSLLTVANLPQVGVGIASFRPNVGGRITDPNPVRSFPLTGELTAEGLDLEIATLAADRPPIEFTIRADPGVSAGLAAGGQLDTLAGRDNVQVIKIDMTPFSPFAGPGIVEEGPQGPVAARFEEQGDDYSIEWQARRVGPANETGEPSS